VALAEIRLQTCQFTERITAEFQPVLEHFTTECFCRDPKVEAVV
jgi:hypothetical protein